MNVNTSGDSFIQIILRRSDILILQPD